MNSLIIDQALDTMELEERIQRRLLGRVRDFRLTALDGGLILQGQAPTYHAKQLAQHAVMDETMIPILANEIEVCACRCELLSV